VKRRYKVPGRRRHLMPLRVWGVVICLLALVVVGIIFVRHYYNEEMRPVSTSQQTQIFTVKEGSSVKEIATELQSQHLIRSAWALELYAHSTQLSNQLQAGVYAFSPSQGTAAIVNTMTKGNVTTRLVTILPGVRIDQVRADLINDGFSVASVDAALNPAQYADLPVLDFKPTTVNSLEGLLWPDSFDKDSDTQPSTIVRESLTEMSQHLTPTVQQEFAAEGLTVYQGLTLASIIGQEVSKPQDQTQVAQVFLSRLQTNMMLGSDVTAYYGAIAAGQSPSLSYDSPYNTLQHTGLPPSPISTITADALDAATHPATTHWLYFVTGDNGTTYFSTTLQQQEANTAQYCHKLCGH
jgi:UPF0755 protein